MQRSNDVIRRDGRRAELLFGLTFLSRITASTSLTVFRDRTTMKSAFHIFLPFIFLPSRQWRPWCQNRSFMA